MIEGVSQHHNPGGFQIETTGSFGQDKSFWTERNYDVLIINLPDDGLLQGYFFTKMRTDLPKNQKMLILCNGISGPLMRLSQEFSRIRMLKTPVDDFVLYRSVIDLLQDYAKGHQQIQPRYNTEQQLEFHSDLHSGKGLGVMKNLSMSGAYFESTSKEFAITAGDLIKLSILVGQPKKQYIFDVKVVWCKPLASGPIGYGVTFINKEEVYNNLLKNL